jgi:S-adenosylmethionine hydrolase
VFVEGREIPRWVRTYGDVRPDELVALISSGGMLEVAVVRGNAARHLGAGFGAEVRVTFVRKD